MNKQVLFLCPHNAAKSVMATHYFNKQVSNEGVSAEAFSAGTAPDENVAPHVAALLTKEGYGETAHKPRKVSRADLREADLVVSIGCELDDLPETPEHVQQWDNIPMPSQDLNGSWEQIKVRVDELIGQLQTSP